MADQAYMLPICKCGHPKAQHNRFVNHMFLGCSNRDCGCDKFTADPMAELATDSEQTDSTEYQRSIYNECVQH